MTTQLEPSVVPAGFALPVGVPGHPGWVRADLEPALVTAGRGPARPGAGSLSLLRAPCDLEVVIPAFNEEGRLPATLAAVLPELRHLGRISSRVVVVDNGSSDRTAEVADAVRRRTGQDIVVVGCSRPGKGAAVSRGIETSDAAYVGFLDADLAVPAAAIPEALRRLTSGAEIVIGSRRCEGARYAVPQPLLRRVCGWGFRRAVRDLLPAITDTQCGFKFFSRRAARGLFDDLVTAGFTFDVELLLRAHDLGISVTEMPVVWSDNAASTLRLGAHSGQIARELIDLRRRRGTARMQYARRAQVSAADIGARRRADETPSSQARGAGEPARASRRTTLQPAYAGSPDGARTARQA